MSQEYGCGFGVDSGSVSHKAPARTRLPLEGSTSWLTYVVVWVFGSSGLVGLRPQLLTSCWLEASLTSLLHGPLHRSCHIAAADFTRVSKWGKTVPARLQSVCLTLAMEFESCHFFHVLFMRRKSPGPPQTPWKGDYTGARILGSGHRWEPCQNLPTSALQTWWVLSLLHYVFPSRWFRAVCL